MQPFLQKGTKVLIQKKWFFCRIYGEDIIVLHDPRNEKLIIKRVKIIQDGKYYVLGDNAKKSTDSRVFGWVSKKYIIGKMIKTKSS